MRSGTVVLLATMAVIVLGALLLFSTARRADRRRALGELSRETVAADRGAESAQSVLGDPSETVALTGKEVERAAVLERQRRVVLPATVTPPSPPALPPDPETLGVTRRQVLNRGILTVFGLSVGSFGASMLAFIWPQLSGGFGSKIKAGKLDDILSQIADKKEPFYVAEGRFYINPYPKDAVPKANSVPAYGAVLPGYKEGVVALYQKCVHLGCRVPWCKTSQWFECPCHGSQYNRVGEKKGGPAPRGLDRFIVSVEGGTVMVDTKQQIVGPPIGVNTTGQEADGPHCVSGGE